MGPASEGGEHLRVPAAQYPARRRDRGGGRAGHVGAARSGSGSRTGGHSPGIPCPGWDFPWKANCLCSLGVSERDGPPLWKVSSPQPCAEAEEAPPHSPPPRWASSEPRLLPTTAPPGPGGRGAGLAGIDRLCWGRLCAGNPRSPSRAQASGSLAAGWPCPRHQSTFLGVFGPRILRLGPAWLVGSGEGWGWGGVQSRVESLGSVVSAGCPPGAPAGWDLPGKTLSCQQACQHWPLHCQSWGRLCLGHLRPHLLLLLPCPPDLVLSQVGGSRQRAGAADSVRGLSCARLTS